MRAAGRCHRRGAGSSPRPRAAGPAAPRPARRRHPGTDRAGRSARCGGSGPRCGRGARPRSRLPEPGRSPARGSSVNVAGAEMSDPPSLHTSRHRRPWVSWSSFTASRSWTRPPMRPGTTKSAMPLHDRLNADRRRLPMVRVDKPYTFEGPDGTVSLLDLFDGRQQLVMHHFMFGPDWDTGCPSCSSAADGIGNLRQLHVRNTTLVAVSRAPYKKLAAFRERMGWTFPWYSSYGTEFNYDFHATLDDRVEPVLLHFRTADELAEAGTPWTDGPWEASMNGEGAAGHQRVPPGRRRGLPHLLDLRPRHRRIPQWLPLPGSHRSWPSGGVGGATRTCGPARAPGRRPRDAAARRVRHLNHPAPEHLPSTRYG